MTGALQKAKLVSQENRSDALVLHYNPATITMRTGARYARPAAGRGEKGAPAGEFTAAEPVTYTMDIVLDSVDDPSRKVPDAIIKLVDWTRTTIESRDRQTPSPPLLMLEWGGRHWGPVHITKLKVDHTLFAPDGTPVRAKVNLRLTEVGSEPGRTNPTSGGSPGRRRVLLGGVDGLEQVAQREYGDPALWRAVAVANGIDDPTRIPRGTALLVPPTHEARSVAGPCRG